MSTLNRKAQPKVLTNFYKPKQRIEARERGNATIIACIIVIIVVALIRGL